VKKQRRKVFFAPWLHCVFAFKQRQNKRPLHLAEALAVAGAYFLPLALTASGKYISSTYCFTMRRMLNCGARVETHSLMRLIQPAEIVCESP
jgi:hypothetical protein